MTKTIIQFILSMKLGLGLIINHFMAQCEQKIAERKKPTNAILTYFQTSKIRIVTILFISSFDNLDGYFFYIYFLDSG